MNIEKIMKVEPTPEDRAKRQKSRVYLWDSSKEIADQIIAGLDRKASRKYIDLIKQAVEEAELVGAIDNFTYRDKACTCGASPGFVASGWMLDRRGIPCDLHVLYTATEEDETPPVVEEIEEKVPADEPLNDQVESDNVSNGVAEERAARRGRLSEQLTDNQIQRPSFAAKRSYTRKVTLRNLPLTQRLQDSRAN